MFNLNSVAISDGKAEEYYKLITQNRKGIAKADKLCKEYFEKNFKEIILMKPNQLQKFVKTFDSRKDKAAVVDVFKNLSVKTNPKNAGYIVNTLYQKMPHDARKLIYNLANVKTCPYCNRNYLDVIDGKEYHTTFELDHFYNKDDYPMLAVSLYNLIPSCPSCNRIKGKTTFQYYPYDSKRDMSSEIKFSYNVKSAIKFTEVKNEDDIEVKVKCDDSAMGEYLQELYSNHKDIALEIIQKTKFYGEGYAKGLCEQLGELFPSKAEVYRMLYGNYLDKEDWTKRPLSKFTYDIANEALKGLKIDKW